MDPKTEKSLAESLETNTDVLPYIPFLLQDLWELGSSIDLILESINKLNLFSHSNVLDLGCGKGALSVPIAAQFGFDVVGIDAMKEFLQIARIKSSEFNVDNRCQFLNQEMRDYVLKPHSFAIVILASIGGIFGNWQNTIANLRTQVKDGGYMIIDDGYLKNKKSLDRNGYAHYCDHKSSIQALTSFGDILIEEKSTTEKSLDINNHYMDLIEIRGRELTSSNPELEEKIKGYIKNQHEECKVLEKELNGVVWVMQKKD
jgi:2-polyprenyl-3-methyl-5-hydroxy-6-metoxy-1,4-benzoquinol methylase